VKAWKQEDSDQIDIIQVSDSSVEILENPGPIEKSQLVPNISQRSYVKLSSPQKHQPRFKEDEIQLVKREQEPEPELDHD
jgi:hypothetical protein